MFTDGLVERRGSHLDERLSLLESSLRASPSNEPGLVADFVIDAMTSDARSSDDIVVLTARGDRCSTPPSSESPGPRSRRRPALPYCDGVPREEAVAPLVGAHMPVPCLDGHERPYRDLDCAASTPALQSVADRVSEFLPWYSSVHRGAGYKSRRATAAYEEARDSVHRFARRPPGGDDVVVLVRNTTEAINQLAYRLQLAPDDVVATTVVEHHANLLPWARVATRRWVECGTNGTFETDDVVRVLDDGRRPALLALTGASNVTGWLPPVEEICAEAHARGVPVLLDAAQLAPHRPLPAGPDFLAFSGHKLYAPFGAGALVGPRRVFERGDPFLAGGGAVDLVDLDEVIWTDPPEREEAGSPNVVGAVAFGTAMDEVERIGWDVVAGHEAVLATQLYDGLRDIDGVQRARAPVGARPARRARRGHLHRGRHAPRPGGGPAECRVRDRSPARLLLRPSLPHPTARRRPRRRGPGTGRRATRRPQRHSGRRSGQLRPRHRRRRRRGAARRAARPGGRRTAACALPPGRRHRRLLAGGRCRGLERRPTDRQAPPARGVERRRAPAAGPRSRTRRAGPRHGGVRQFPRAARPWATWRGSPRMPRSPCPARA